MKIHFTIDITNADLLAFAALANKKIDQCAAPIGRPRKPVEIAAVAPPPIPPEPEPEKKVERKGSGPQFDPGFLKIIQDAPEPFTRRSIAVASGVDVVDVTLRLNRLHKKGWIEQPVKHLWRKTKTFGVKE